MNCNNVQCNPREPWNERMAEEVEVTARQTLVKETTVTVSGYHTCVEHEIDPDTGRYERVSYQEPDDDADELFRMQHRKPLQIIECCWTICRQLRSAGHHFYAGVNIDDLKIDCEDWNEEEPEVKSEEL